MSLLMKDMIVTLLLVAAPAGQNTITVVASAVTKVITDHPKIVVLDQNAAKPVKPDTMRRHISPLPKDHDFTKIPPGASYVPGELLVRFAPRDNGTQWSIAEKEIVIRRLGGRILKHYRLIPGLVLVALPPGQTIQRALIIYNNAIEILYAEPNYIVRIPEQPEPKPDPKPGPKRIPSGKRQIALRHQSPGLRPVHSNRAKKTVPLSRPSSHRKR